MAIKRCDMCFQDKPALTPVLPGASAMVCKACAYKVGQVLGFIAYHGGVVQWGLALPHGDGETVETEKERGKK